MAVSDYLQVYLVTDQALALGRSLVEVVARAVEGGVTAVQVREKTLATGDFLAQVVELKKVLADSGVPLFVNDRVDIAIAAAVDGVHVGQHDLPVAVARRLIGPGVLLGVSVANEMEARHALAEGADYISVSPVFLTPTKPDADRAVGLEGVRRIRAAAGDAPLLAIGGIDARNAAAVVRAGADGVSVVSAIMSAANPTEAAASLRAEVTAALEGRRSHG